MAHVAGNIRLTKALESGASAVGMRNMKPPAAASGFINGYINELLDLADAVIGKVRDVQNTIYINNIERIIEARC